MNIYVLSAGLGEEYDYSWKQAEEAPSLPHEAAQWHDRLLSDGDADFALVAGHSPHGWSIEFRNLHLPGIIDVRNRQIKLNICFCGLRSEKEVRALALAYLDLPLQYRNETRCLGRYSDELCKAYRKTEDGDYAYDFAAAEAWARKAIESFMPGLRDTSPTEKVECSINPREAAIIERLKKHIIKYALQDQDGVRMVWSQLFVDSAIPADILLTGTKEKSNWHTETLTPETTCQNIPAEKNLSPILHDVQEKAKEIIESSKPLLQEGKKIVSKRIKAFVRDVTKLAAQENPKNPFNHR